MDELDQDIIRMSRVWDTHRSDFTKTLSTMAQMSLCGKMDILDFSGSAATRKESLQNMFNIIVAQEAEKWLVNLRNRIHCVILCDWIDREVKCRKSYMSQDPVPGLR